MRRSALAVLLLGVLIAVTPGVALGAKHKHKATHKSHAKGLAAPGLQSPANGASFQSFPVIQWSAVSGAALYEYQIAQDPKFESIALGTGNGKGAARTHSTAAALDTAVADGTYYWRVRAISAKDAPGAWSPTRTSVKAWTLAPRLFGPTALSVSWPSNPLVLNWSPVPYATKYLITIATDPALSNAVVGSVTQPVDTQGTVAALPTSLAQGQYFWAITPVDAQGHRGTRSPVGMFNWTWPTTTNTSVTDLNPNPQVFDPQFSWAPIPGAAKYEVEVNSSQDFPAGSKWCCSDLTIGTSLSPKQVLANNGYYWRVRAIDVRGNAGVWNVGSPFTKAFDSVTPTIPTLTLRDTSGNALPAPQTTSAPVVTWDPVPGASRYEVQVAPYGGTGCNWAAPRTFETGTTAWTPLGNGGTHIGPSAWPSPQAGSVAVGGTYCLRVLARSDDDAKGNQVVSDWTYLNGISSPAFTYSASSPSGSPTPTPASSYLQPAGGAVTPRTPLFTWSPVQGAASYYVVIARDSGFTQVVDIGFTTIPAYAPPLDNGAPLIDETTAYYWAVIPSPTSDGSVVNYPEPSQNSPQLFSKSSVAPAPQAPVNGVTVSAQPTFSWSPSENARNYRLQVAQDPTFGNPIDDVTTDSTAFTSSSTYPADTVLYWRVRANDWNNQGLNWSATQTFRRTLPVPTPAANNSTGGEQIPALAWTPVQGAVAYDMHVDQVDGTTRDFTVDSPVLTPSLWYGMGIWRWEVRAEFPSSSGGNVAGGYFAPQQFVRTFAAPTGATGVKAGTRIVLSWNPDLAAKQYQVDLSTTSGFSNTIDSRKVDGTSWAPDIDFSQAQAKGTLYWRVAAVDQGGNVGKFAGGSFAGPKPHLYCTTTVKKHGKKKRKVRTCSTKKPKKHKAKKKHH
jgi:hypothetical protein